MQDTDSLNDFISTQDVGKKVKFDILRWNDMTSHWDKKSFTVTIGNKPADFEQRMRPQQEQSPSNQGQGNGMPSFPLFP